MKRRICATVAAVAVAVIISIFSVNVNGFHMAVFSNIGLADLHTPAKVIEAYAVSVDEPEGESLKLRLVCGIAKKSVVKVLMREHAGSGLIWRMDSGRLIIASSRHLLMEDVYASVIFCDGTQTQARILGYSQQYDVGFLCIETKELSESTLRKINAVVPFLDDIEGSVQVRSVFLSERAGADIIQLGVNLGEGGLMFSKGYIMAADFSPVFNCFMIQTKCYARAGMSGGGMFDESGQLIGMISGGDVSETSSSKESEVTYSLPAGTIENEYLAILRDFSDD